MPENPLTQARFDHVDDTGRLVFTAGEVRFVVDADDTLERALLEAKQIREEKGRAAQPATNATLPISQIQALIRAGADPARVAERYRLSEALVRRFSAAVEVEKQYAIEQFFTVPAPKETRVRTTAELIERTLAAAGIGMESVTWRATRRGLEPWRITAMFTSAGRQAKAEWSWNMHDNAITPLNPTARKLMGITSSGQGVEGGDEFSMPVSLPGDSVRSARIERAVSAWNTPEPTLPAARPEARLPRTAGDVAYNPATATPNTAPNTAAGTISNLATSGTAVSSVTMSDAVAGTASHVSSTTTGGTPTTPSALPLSSGPVNALPTVSGNTTNSVTASGTNSATGSERITETIAVPSTTHTGMNGSAQARQTQTEQSAQTVAEHAKQAAAMQAGQSVAQSERSTSQPVANTKPAKRRSGRSAVPSWDEILFGE